MVKSKKRSVDVRSKKDVTEFEKTLSVGPITLVLVYADWCGHCQNFKKDIWTDLENLPNKKINLASVHYDQLSNTSQREAKINGYPSLLVIGNDKKAATFKAENEVTNALPDSRNKEMLETMVTSDPATLPDVLDNSATTLEFQPNTLTKRNKVNTTELTAPNTSADRLFIENEGMNTLRNNGMMMENEMNTLTANSMQKKSNQTGGSLLDTLVKLAQFTAPAALLTGAAAVVKCKKRKSRKSKKSKKRTTRRY
jgi:thiol-disulfide isomerase/thioredoxin